MPPKLTLQQQHNTKPPSSIEIEIDTLKAGKDAHQLQHTTYTGKFDQYKLDWTAFTAAWTAAGSQNGPKIDALNDLVRKQNDLIRAQDNYLKAQHDLLILATNAILFIQRFVKKLFKL